MKTCIDNQKPKTEAMNSAPGENNLDFNMTIVQEKIKIVHLNNVSFVFAAPALKRVLF
jgi:hypothetical protein